MKAKSKKKLLALFLSSMMLTSAFAFASCKDDDTTDNTDDTETEDTTEIEDDGLLITNGGFETFNKKDGLNLIGTSVNGWTRSTNTATSGSALSSKSASGIIDTEDDAWNDLTTSKLGELKASELTEEQAKEKWSSMSAKDKLDYYKAWKDNDDNDDKEISDLEFYQAFNIDDEDLPTCANPKTHDNSTENTNVLMIHNHYYNSSYETIGTAQKFTSSSTVTVQAGTSAKLSLWVKTSDLQSTTSAGESQEAVDKGAYIRVTNNLGGTAQDPLEIKNINTKGVTENNGWVQYTLLLKGASFTDTTFTLVLGLGQSGGTDRYEYVNGYAFFDDIQVETLKNDDYDKLVDANEDNILDTGVTEITIDVKKEQRVVEAKNVKDVKYFAVNYYESAEPEDINVNYPDFWNVNAWNFEATTEENGNKTYVSTTNLAPAGTTIAPTLATGLSNTNDLIQIFDTPDAMNGSTNAYLQTVYNDYLKDTDKDNDFLKNQTDKKLLMLLSASGASYTAKLDYDFIMPADKYTAISFFVKTSDMTGFTGGGVKVVNKNDSSNAVSLSNISTATLEGVKIGDTEDYYDGWQKCYLFVSNETDETQYFNLSFSFGPTTIYDSTETSYQSGFMAVTGFEQYDMDEKIFAFAKSGSYSQILNLESADDDDNTSAGFDNALSVSDRTLEDGYANLQNFKGVTSDSDYVSANGTGSKLEINTLATAGLLSKENITKLDDSDNEIPNDKYTEILTALGGSGANNEEKWASVFGGDAILGEAKQPLVIYNPDEALSYGFIGKSTAVTDYQPISVRVKVSAGAKAFIYLTDMDDNSYQKTLTVGRNQTYWYDDDGNICASDPAKSGFSAKRDTAFKLQSNGLYKVNPTWTGATGIDANAYYANLSVYEKDKDNGNLLVAEGGVSYNYTSNWLNDGNDGIAFYYNKDTQKYYADSAKTVEVNDLASIANLARYEQKARQSAMFEVGETNGEWAIVTFYIHAGETPKNYRLEVWSGSRDGAVKNPAGSVVIFDKITSDALTADTWKSNLDERKEDLTEETDYFESVFSFYDSNKFLRYDANADTNEVGNSYESYLSSAYTSSIAYLKYAKDNVYEMYIDYSLSDVTVTADVDEDETEDTETEEETKPESEMNIWLLISSIAIAGVLLLAVVSIIVRSIVKKARKNRGAKVSKPKKK